MLKLIVLSVLLNASDSNTHITLPPEPIKVEARKRRGKGMKGRRRIGGGLK